MSQRCTRTDIRAQLLNTELAELIRTAIWAAEKF
jgi:hypothetical protein